MIFVDIKALISSLRNKKADFSTPIQTPSHKTSRFSPSTLTFSACIPSGTVSPYSLLPPHVPSLSVLVSTCYRLTLPTQQLLLNIGFLYTIPNQKYSSIISNVGNIPIHNYIYIFFIQFHSMANSIRFFASNQRAT
jgi:hypothetical protein